MFGLANRKAVHDAFYKGDESTLGVDEISEIIAFKAPSNMSRWYGYPDWLSASAIITLVALSIQYKSDFYTNRGVLAFILSVAGAVDPKEWKKIQSLVQGAVGMGNNFRNLAIQLGNKDTVLKVDKLTSSDKTELQFSKDSEIYAQMIVSSHRVPPVLANILIPGKLGATNELVQAIIAFQLLVIGPHQNVIQQTLARTLGGKEGISKLKPEDFRLRKITSQFNIEGLDTVANMKEDATTATDDKGKPRDVSDGPKD
jgi:capsid portal protein